MSKKIDNRIYSIKTITGGLLALALSFGIIYGVYILFNDLVVPTATVITSDVSPGISSGIKYLKTNINENLSNVANQTNVSLANINENLNNITNQTSENLNNITNQTNENLNNITNQTNETATGTSENAPGFGIVVSLVGLFTLAIIIKRYNRRL